MLKVDMAFNDMCDFFQPLGINVVKGAQLFAVDIQHGNHIAFNIVQGDDNLAARQAAAGNVARKLFHIGDDHGAVLLPCSAAHATALLDVIASHRSLKDSQLQNVVLNHVESCPPESHRLVNEGDGIGQLPDRIVLALNQALDLLDKHLIS